MKKTLRSHTTLAALLLVLPACLTTAAAPQPANDFLYVCIQGAAQVSVIDMGTNAVVETIDLQRLGFGANSRPHHTAVEADGSYWYVSLIGDNRVLKFNRKNELVGQAEFEAPGMLAMHPTEGVLFVGRSMKAVSPPRRIGVIQRSTMEIEEVDVFFARPHALAVHPNGRDLYTASLATNQMATLNLATNDLNITSLDDPPHVFVQFAISPDGRRMVATGQLTGKLLFFDVSRPSEPTFVEAIDVNAHPWHPAFTPDGRFVYFGNKEANTVTVVDTDTRTIAAVIEGRGIAQPHGVAMSPDGRYVYISNNNTRGEYPASRGGTAPGTVVVINTATHEIEQEIEVGPNATGLSTRLRP